MRVPQQIAHPYHFTVKLKYNKPHIHDELTIFFLFSKLNYAQSAKDFGILEKNV